MNDSLIVVDCFMRFTDKEGASWVSAHRVIAGGRFVESMKVQYTNEGGSAEQITKEQYNGEKAAGRAR